MRSVEPLIESMQQGDGHVVVDVAAGAKGLVAILFVLGQEMDERPVDGGEARRLVGAGARLTRRAERVMARVSPAAGPTPGQYP
jgi:hypothetical protein